MELSYGRCKWEEAERVQREMGKMILRCSSKMANEVVLGELGWWSLRARRDLLRLKFWGKIVSRMSSSRLVKHVYSVSRARYEAGKSSKWCKYTHELLKELGMNDVWQQGTITCNMTTWDKELREKIHAREEKEWLARMQTKPKLRTYRTIKHKLEFEPYLNHDNTYARETMTRLRGGTNELRIETGRYPNTNRDRRLDEDERRCLLCMLGEVEDERHFVLSCVVYKEMRKKMFEVVKEVMLKKKKEEIETVLETDEGRQRIFRALMGDSEEVVEGRTLLRRAALVFCRNAMKRRNKIVQIKLDQRT